MAVSCAQGTMRFQFSLNVQLLNSFNFSLSKFAFQLQTHSSTYLHPKYVFLRCCYPNSALRELQHFSVIHFIEAPLHSPIFSSTVENMVGLLFVYSTEAKFYHIILHAKYHLEFIVTFIIKTDSSLLNIILMFSITTKILLFYFLSSSHKTSKYKDCYVHILETSHN